jgi:hypothetical protein
MATTSPVDDGLLVNRSPAFPPWVMARGCPAARGRWDQSTIVRRRSDAAPSCRIGSRQCLIRRLISVCSTNERMMTSPKNNCE